MEYNSPGRSIMKTILVSLFAGALSFLAVQAQTPFDVQTYETFLQNTQNMTSAELRAFHSAGIFNNKIAPSTFPSYFDSINRHYSLTPYETNLLKNNGFVVTSRLSKPTFLGAFSDIFYRDLPVYVSSDAILHAIHMSYDAILMDVERQQLIPWLDTLLMQMHAQVPVLASRYASEKSMSTALKDLDVYLTVPRKLLGKSINPVYPENASTIAALVQYIQALKPRDIPLFSASYRSFDFSQFTVRGHYTTDQILSQYFQAMIWLGRTEIYLIAPQQAGVQVPDSDVQRQTILSALTTESINGAHVQRLLDTLDAVIQFFVGESDNVTCKNIQSLLQENSIQQANALLDTSVWKKFQNTLLQKPYTFQRIQSQILWSDPCSPDKVRPASAFLLLGQRFIVDSYVTSNVVYDRVKKLRMLPSSLDVLFALGNNAAAQLLDPQLQLYSYAPNLAALRYMVDSYDDSFWTSTIYNGWLNCIRGLNPPAVRSSLPAFMQTAAWWQQKMNTQLASWAELRHDNLLYAKQSYTAGVICSFPESYVEPIPEFYSRIRTLAGIASLFFNRMNMGQASRYFQTLASTADTLQAIAQKSMTQTPTTQQEQLFLKRMIILPDGMCGASYTGWYPQLYYTGKRGFDTYDALVADIHTAPTDAYGNFVGWVLHVGTGKIDMMLLNSTTPDGRPMSYIGPVYRYYEYVSTNFKRLTDEEWRAMGENPPLARPSFVHLYLADSTGNSPGSASSLMTTSVHENTPSPIPMDFRIGQNFPNPFNSTTVIPFSLPMLLDHQPVSVKIFNTTGQEIAVLLNQELPEGSYLVRWDGTTRSGSAAASGVYFYTVTIGLKQQTGKMMLVK
jgi:hypothetical protein